MPSDKENTREKRPLIDRRNWYSLSVDAVRAWAIFFGVVGLLVAAAVGYNVLQSFSTARQAQIVIDEAEFLLTRVQTEAGAASTSESYAEAWQNLQQARRDLAAGNHKSALVAARWSQNLFSSLLDDVRHKAPAGEAQFVGVQGGVEFRRGDGAVAGGAQPHRPAIGRLREDRWQRLRRRDFLRRHELQIRPDTVVLISRQRTDSGAPSDDAVTLQYGWINLDTESRPSRVRTPEAEATIAQSSRVELTYDRDRRTSRFSSFEGSMAIRTRVGTMRRVGTMEQVTMTAAGLGAAVEAAELSRAPVAGSRRQSGAR